MFYRLDKESGIELFSQSETVKSGMSNESYLEWLESFEYMTSGSMHVALRGIEVFIEGVLEECVEFHVSSDTGSSAVANLKALNSFLKIPSCTFITSKDMKLINMMCKRFCFSKAYLGIDTTTGDKRYLVYRLL